MGRINLLDSSRLSAEEKRELRNSIVDWYKRGILHSITEFLKNWGVEEINIDSETEDVQIWIAPK